MHKVLEFMGKDHDRLDKINLWLVEKYKTERKSLGRKPETINKELGVLRRMFNLAMEWKRIRSNPIEGIKLMKVTQTIYRTLKDSEVMKLCKSASPHFKPIILFAFFTGMRRGEIANLKWENLDLDHRYIHVKETKNDEERHIPVCDPLYDILIELKDQATSEYVFTTQKGEPYKSPSAWKRAWATALRKSGIPHCRFHDLRHTFTSNLIVDEKEDFATVMALTGHKDISMLKRYSHTKEEAKKMAINKLGNRLKEDTLDTYMDTNTQDQHNPDSSIIDLTPRNHGII